MLKQEQLYGMNGVVSSASRLLEVGKPFADIATILRQDMHAAYGQATHELHAIAADDDAVGIIAARTYMHSNGFLKMPLVQPGDPWAPTSTWAGLNLRLHVWRGTGSPPNLGDPHTHRWDFISCILTGRFTEQRWAMEPAEGGDWYQYVHHSAHGTNLTNREGDGQRYAGTLRAVMLRDPGEVYSAVGTDVHTFGPDTPHGNMERVFATLVLTMPPSNSATPIYKPSPMVEADMVLDTERATTQAIVAALNDTADWCMGDK